MKLIARTFGILSRPTVSNDWPIIIGGSHRSGTTLVRRLLNGHPRIFCPPEIKFHKDLLGQFPNDPLTHTRLASSLKALRLSTEVYLDEFGRALCRCYEHATRNAGKSRWADKNPENAVNVVHWHRLLQGRMAFLLVVRHPFDIISSIQEIGMGNVIPADLEGRAMHVRDYIEAGLAYVDGHPKNSLILRYEELVSRPREELGSLLDWLDESYDESMLSSLGSEVHGRGLEDPKSRNRAEISSSSVNRWRKELSPQDLLIARRILAPLADRLSYDLD